MRWLDAGGDLAQSNRIHQCADRASIRSKHLPKGLLHPADFPYLQTKSQTLSASRLSSRSAPALNLHSARCSAGAKLPATSCLGAFRSPAASARGEPRHADNRKPAHVRTHAAQRYSITSSARVSRVWSDGRSSAGVSADGGKGTSA